MSGSRFSELKAESRYLNTGHHITFQPYQLGFYICDKTEPNQRWGGLSSTQSSKRSRILFMGTNMAQMGDVQNEGIC